MKPADRAWHEAVQPIVDYCEEHRGTRTEIVKLLKGVMPQPRVSEYLNTDKQRRKQPLIGAGLLLVRAFEAVKRKSK